MIAAICPSQTSRTRSRRRTGETTTDQQSSGPRELASRRGDKRAAAQPVSTSSVSRIRRLLDMEIEFVDNPEFRAALHGGETARDALKNSREGDAPGLPLPHAMNNGGTLTAMCSAPLLGPDLERELFRRMNYLKYHVHVLRQRLDDARPDVETLELAEQLLAESIALRNRIVSANLRLVVAMARRFANARYSLDELIDEGIFTLLRAVERFDFDRGFRFSTYAVRAIQHNLVRYVGRRRQDDERFRSGEVESLQEPVSDGEELFSEQRWESMQDSLSAMLQRLDKRERAIIQARFAMGGEAKVQTLSMLARKFGVCKERIRQLEKRALEKLRSMAHEMRFEHPESEQ